MSAESTPPMSKIVVQTLIRGLEESKNTMQTMQTRIHSMEITLTELKSHSENISEDVSQMVKIIRDGNGKEPLIERVQKLETKADAFDKHLDEKRVTQMEHSKGSWQLKVAIATGTLGMISGVVTTILNLFFQ